MECHLGAPPDAKLIPADRVRETCAAIRDAVAALKAILLITEQHGGGLIPPEVMERLDEAQRRGA
jgi:hypothetical protein